MHSSAARASDHMHARVLPEHFRSPVANPSRPTVWGPLTYSARETQVHISFSHENSLSALGLVSISIFLSPPYLIEKWEKTSLYTLIL